jgi:hypothetical protein
MTTHTLHYKHCVQCRSTRWLPDRAPAACPKCGGAIVDTTLTIAVGEPVQMRPSANDHGQLALPLPSQEVDQPVDPFAFRQARGAIIPVADLRPPETIVREMRDAE